jgi:hypothetical protein
VSPQRYRVAIPALDRVRRGGEEEVADLPVAFLRWWFLTPLEGQLFAASEPTDPVWLLRAGPSVVELRTARCARGEGLLGLRRAGLRAERVLECRASPAAASIGDAAEYDDLVSGLHVQIDVESVAEAPPDERAFRDPDSVDATGSGGAP